LNKLPYIVNLIWDKLIQAVWFSGANEMRDILFVPEQKYKAKEMKDAIFQREWELLKPVIGISSGGPRNVKHVWTDNDRECLASRYAELQPIWIEAKKIAKAAQESDIAILHAARLCLPANVELSVVRLRKELTEWKNKRTV